MKGYLTPDIRSRVIDNGFGEAGVCGLPAASSVDRFVDES